MQKVTTVRVGKFHLKRFEIGRRHRLKTNALEIIDHGFVDRAKLRDHSPKLFEREIGGHADRSRASDRRRNFRIENGRELRCRLRSERGGV